MTQPPILIVIPVSNVDVHLAEAMIQWVGVLGGMNHPALLVTSDDVKQEHLWPLMEKAFLRNYHYHAPLGANDVGWPDGANALFRETAKYVENRCQRAWYFMEPDNAPTSTGWMDRLEADYSNDSGSRPCFGFINPSYIVQAGQTIQHGQHLVGTAVYPRYLRQITTKHFDCYGRAFDVVIAPDVVPRSRHTNLIRHNWLTDSYQFDGTQITCQPREGRLPGQKGFSIPRPFNPADHAVVHGCKDHSVYEALLEWSWETGRIAHPETIAVPNELYAEAPHVDVPPEPVHEEPIVPTEATEDTPRKKGRRMKRCAVKSKVA